ncbi:hypothetical protein [Staphylococcus xylosus]|uniref:hypothetical protein n=1 Tax=Staphylococcus xylosus TaxID=1288 RepID=UPI001CDD2D1A|nr:hypothetical protein [Staphylococcus xylosus]UBV40017.1 hypothetical protein JGY87_12640 [Staphylococcus xylosus]
MLNSLFTIYISTIALYEVTHLGSLLPNPALKTIGVSAILHSFDLLIKNLYDYFF